MRGFRERAFFGLLDELIPRQAGAARALDVGCGAGRLMVALGRVGWTVEGLELDPVAAEVARRTSGGRVTLGDLFTADIPDAAFDLVVLSHVFEHLTDPCAALRRIAGLLTLSGTAVLIYPNPDGLGARLFRRRWAGWDPPRHLVIPPSQALAVAARRNGLRPLKVRTASRSFGGFSWRVGSDSPLLPSSVPAGWSGKLLQAISSGRFLKKASALGRCLGIDGGEEIVVVLAKGGR